MKICDVRYVWFDELGLDVDVSEFSSVTFGDAHMTLITKRQLIEEVGEDAVAATSSLPDDVFVALPG